MSPILLAADLIAVAVLVGGLFVPRHARRDLVVSLLVVNVAVFAVSAALSVSTAAAGIGLGLFGVLSIIRLRSEELAQHEVAYYFASLSLGLIAGLGGLATPWVFGLMGLVLAALYLGDHPRITRRATRTYLVLDRAYTDEAALRGRLETMLGTEILGVDVSRIDLVNDSTHVTVRAAKPRGARGARGARATRQNVEAQLVESQRVDSQHGPHAVEVVR